MIPALLSVLWLATEVPATSNQPDPAPAEASKEERKICKREMDTTSRMGSKRVCLTAAQWKARDGGDVKGLGFVTK